MSVHERWGNDVRIHDLVIVGGGPAGLGAAYRLRDQDLDIKVLEAEPEVGGRTKSVRMPGGMANAGAQFVYRSTRSEELVNELNLEVVPFEPSTYGIAIDGVTSVGSTNRDVVDGLPLSPEERGALLAVLDEAVEEYRQSTAHGIFTDRADALGNESVAERLRRMPPRVAEIIGTAIRGGAVGEPAKLLARYALRYFASYPAHEAENRLLLVNGQQQISLAMASALEPDLIDLETRATEVAPDGTSGAYVITAQGPDGARSYRAHQVLVTVPAPLVSDLVPGLPRYKLDALAEAETPGNTTMIVAVNLSGIEEYRQWSFITTVGSRFNCIINSTPGRWRSPDEPGIVHFICYGNDPGHLPEIHTDEGERRAWIDDFLNVAPALRGRVVDYHIQTWRHCFALLSPMRAGVLGELQAPMGRIHFAGDWTSATAGTHGALSEAERAADDVLANLDRGRAASFRHF